MYAVIKTGGKQYRVSAGEKLKVEQIAADVGQRDRARPGAAGRRRRRVKLGTPLVAGATVKAKVLAHGRGEKVRIFKMRRRKHYRKTPGPPAELHRDRNPRDRSWINGAQHHGT